MRSPRLNPNASVVLRQQMRIATRHVAKPHKSVWHNPYPSTGAMALFVALRRLQRCAASSRDGGDDDDAGWLRKQLQAMLAPFAFQLPDDAAVVFLTVFFGGGSNLTHALTWGVILLSLAPAVFGGTLVAFGAYAGRSPAQNMGLVRAVYEATFAAFADARFSLAWVSELDVSQLDPGRLWGYVTSVAQYYLLDAAHFKRAAGAMLAAGVVLSVARSLMMLAVSLFACTSGSAATMSAWRDPRRWPRSVVTASSALAPAVASWRAGWGEPQAGGRPASKTARSFRQPSRAGPRFGLQTKEDAQTAEEDKA